MTATIKAGSKIRNARNTLVEGTLGCLVRARETPACYAEALFRYYR